MKKTLTLAGLALMGMASAASGQVLSPVIAGGPHDLTSGSALRNTNTSIAGQTCVFCHTPHNAKTVAPFRGDRSRMRNKEPNPLTTMPAMRPVRAGGNHLRAGGVAAE